MAASANDSFGSRAEALAALELAVYPTQSLWGLAFGAQGAWETVQEDDEFLERAYGLKLGPRLRLPGNPYLEAGLDAQVSNLSQFGREGTWWEIGISPFIRFNYMLR